MLIVVFLNMLNLVSANFIIVLAPAQVKLTGGPDGDVAGNMLKILHREYADQVSMYPSGN